MSAERLDSSLHLPSLSIKGFRGFVDLSISRLSRVTLIAGMNNTGKTSILEGVRLLTEEANPDVIREILRLREENTEGLVTEMGGTEREVFLVSALFHGFPELSGYLEPILISCCDGSRQLRMEVGWFVERERDEGGFVTLVPEEAELSDDPESFPALVVTTGNRRRISRIEQIDRTASNRRPSLRRDSSQVSSKFVSSSVPERTEMLGPLWDNIALTPREDYVVDALRIIEPSISAVSMIGQQSSRSSRTAVVRSDNFNRRVPLRSFGDGMNRLFAIVLSMVNANGGVLLIDEFENGMHYTVQVDAWRMLFRIAHELDVQVLATTHSLDCVAGFRQAAAELEEEEGLLVRIDRHGDLTRVVEYNEQDLQIAISQRIEVR